MMFAQLLTRSSFASLVLATLVAVVGSAHETTTRVNPGVDLTNGTTGGSMQGGGGGPTAFPLLTSLNASSACQIDLLVSCVSESLDSSPFIQGCTVAIGNATSSASSGGGGPLGMASSVMGNGSSPSSDAGGASTGYTPTSVYQACACGIFSGYVNCAQMYCSMNANDTAAATLIEGWATSESTLCSGVNITVGPSAGNDSFIITNSSASSAAGGPVSPASSGVAPGLRGMSVVVVTVLVVVAGTVVVMG